MLVFFVDLILLFFAYSFLGWCIEVTLKYFQFHRFINRGFFTGPILPIYGSGAALITVAVSSLARFEYGYGSTFALSFVICGTLEYLTSYWMEKRFHARWWDYSQKPMNLHGRVWIGNLMLFGLGGVAIIRPDPGGVFFFREGDHGLRSDGRFRRGLRSDPFRDEAGQDRGREQRSGQYRGDQQGSLFAFI